MKEIKKCISNGKWYSFNPYKTRCRICGSYYPEDGEAPDCIGFDETKINITQAQWKLLDSANPSFMPADRSKWIEWQKADFKIKETEDDGIYWKRVGEELSERRHRENRYP